MNEQRLPYATLSKDAFAGFLQVKKAVGASENIDHVMIALLELRVSLINGCSYCVHSHSEELKKLSMPDRFIQEVAAWQCSRQFSEEQRAALHWADSLTNISQTHVPDEDFASVKAFYSDVQISDMTMIISNMNAMNRVAIAMRR